MATWTTSNIPNLSGKLAIITGATGGLGLDTALGLSGAGAEVILAGRNPAKGRDAPPAMAEYEPVRQAVLSAFKPEMSGDPTATAAAILKVVDTDNPPLRLLLGTGPLPMIKKLYEGRLATWDQWAEVSNAAHGNRAA